MEKIIKKKEIQRWLEQLSHYAVFGPVAHENGEPGSWHFREIQSPQQLDLEYLNTGEAPKSAVFPQREVLFSFKGNGNLLTNIKEDLPHVNPQILFGIRPCDARGISHLDQVFAGEIPDPYYWQYREATILIGLSCERPPSTNCFCTSVGGSPCLQDGLDILMTGIGDSFYFESLSVKGSDLMASACKSSALFRQPKTDERKTLRKIQNQAPKNIKRHIDEMETASQG
jgi:hypothetical protein